MIVKYSYSYRGKWCGPYEADSADFKNFWKHVCNEVDICYVTEVKTGKTYAYYRDIDEHWSKAMKRDELPKTVQLRLGIGYVMAELG